MEDQQIGRWITVSEAIRRYGDLGANRGRLQMAFLEGRLPGRKVDPGVKNSPLLFRPADVERYLHRYRHRTNVGGRPSGRSGGGQGDRGGT